MYDFTMGISLATHVYVCMVDCKKESVEGWKILWYIGRFARFRDTILRLNALRVVPRT